MNVTIRALVRQVIARSKNLDDASLAAAVLEKLKPADYRAALEQTLPAYVRQMIVAQREPGRVRPPRQATLATAGWKVPAINDGWQRRLDEVYGGAGERKRLGDFTYDDLIHLAATTEAIAKRGLSRAKGWRDLADTLREANVATVRDLPAETLMHTLGAVA
jgi:hypothetical protein